ncbi:MAG: hypothetical protein ACOYBM_04020 [Dethiobacteria bacterium]|nr:hypothetical protein [Bacillota bacterium]
MPVSQGFMPIEQGVIMGSATVYYSRKVVIGCIGMHNSLSEGHYGLFLFD